MKYIRTKDGRIIDLKGWSIVELIGVNTETNEEKKDICYQRNWFEQHGDCCEYKSEYISHNSQVLKQADTIEELCDEFVVEGKSYHIVLDKMGYETIKRYEKDEDTNIYGAIWTDKGLIYVAKVKESVEWELL